VSKKDESRRMAAVQWHGAKDMRVGEVAVPRVTDPLDVVLRVTSSCVCGSDLHIYLGGVGGGRCGDAHVGGPCPFQCVSGRCVCVCKRGGAPWLLSRTVCDQQGGQALGGALAEMPPPPTRTDAGAMPGMKVGDIMGHEFMGTGGRGGPRGRLATAALPAQQRPFTPAPAAARPASVEEVGPEVKTLGRGDRVVTSFDIACGHCFYCRDRLFTSCVSVRGWWGGGGGGWGWGGGGPTAKAASRAGDAGSSGSAMIRLFFGLVGACAVVEA
jgi:hypothetical protein